MNTEKRNFASPILVIIFALCLALVAGQAMGHMHVTTENLNISSKALVSVVKKTEPAVVYIKVEKTKKDNRYGPQVPNDFFNHPFFRQFDGPYYRHQRPQPREFKQRGQGSGFIISKDGLILTNNHVVDNAESIKVILADKREFDAKVIGTDPQTDVALLKIEDPANFPVLALGDSAKLEVGEWVIAIGNPFGLSQTVTVGVVSATGRSSIGINEYEDFIQTDAAINSGNSGGPLINGQGQAIGINTALFSRAGGNIGIGFAIPINMAKAINDQLQKDGKVTRGWLGIVIQNMDRDLAESFGLKQAGGILVSEVQDDSPANAAGLKQGDIIVRLNDNILQDVADLRNQVALLRPKTKVILHVMRNGKDKKIRINIGTQPTNFATRAGAGGDSFFDQYGFSLQELKPEFAEKFGYTPNSGLIVSDVQPGSPAAAAGLKPGHLVEEVNRKPVSNLKELGIALERSKKSGKTLLRVRSGDYSTYVVLVAK